MPNILGTVWHAATHPLLDVGKLFGGGSHSGTDAAMGENDYLKQLRDTYAGLGQGQGQSFGTDMPAARQERSSLLDYLHTGTGQGAIDSFAAPAIANTNRAYNIADNNLTADNAQRFGLGVPGNARGGLSGLAAARAGSISAAQNGAQQQGMALDRQNRFAANTLTDNAQQEDWQRLLQSYGLAGNTAQGILGNNLGFQQQADARQQAQQQQIMQILQLAGAAL